jgi:charged multivesicular body protein 4
VRRVVYTADAHIQEELKNELEELEQEQLNERLAGADHVPVHMPPGAVREDGECLHALPASANTTSASRHRVAEEDDEEAQLRALQAELEA